VKVWDPAFEKVLTTLSNDAPTLWMGDINVALDVIDVSHPQRMKNYAGFRPEERSNLKQLLDKGWVDVWRHQHPNDTQYSWLGYPHRDHHGMRLDNMIVSQSLLPQCANAFLYHPPHHRLIIYPLVYI